MNHGVMTRSQIELLLNSLVNSECIETHISWIILSGKFAYKIKKPVKLSFLDFSSLSLRKYYCQREIDLNRRLTSEIYLDVVPVRNIEDQVIIGQELGSIIDYAVKMKRMDEKSHMQYRIKKNRVNQNHVEQIADQLAAFHIFAEIPAEPPSAPAFLEQFKDIDQVQAFLCMQIGNEVSEVFFQAIKKASELLDYLESRMLERFDQGFFVDGHGDLHSGNIFLLEEPVLFDCIEFNDHFRYLDVLDEIAFFCLDLDYYGKSELESIFIDRYLQINPVIHNNKDHLLFEFFKWYRCNVKLKVQSLKAIQAETTVDLNFRLQRVNGYYQLFCKFLDQLAKKSGLNNEVV